MNRGKWIAGATLLAVILGAGGVWYWYGNQKPPLKYKTAKVERGTVAQVVTATGTINPVQTVQVGSQVSGIIRHLYADFNSEVKAGQLVAVIDPAPFQIKVMEMEANVANSKGSLAKARADLSQRKLDLDRAKALYEQNLIAKADWDNARTAYSTAEAGLQVAEAQVHQAEALLRRAKLDLKYTEIFSPVNGIVISRNVDVGQTVAASFQTPVLFLVAKDLTKMQVDTNVSESDVGGIVEGKDAFFMVDAYPKQPFKGKVIQVRNAPINVQNVVTYDIVVEVNNPDLHLKPGMTANVTIVVERREDVLKLPNAALRFKPTVKADHAKGPELSAAEQPQRGGKSSVLSGRSGREGKTVVPTVWLPAQESEPIPVEVKTGLSDGLFTELIDGPIKEGDEVIVGVEMSRGERPGAALPPGFGSQPSQRPRGL
ncbi:MAG: efflux RND transporter periplasmic adaptor subunit [Nitrospirae bacterium]|nr:MAG: efflux RND transporter periplasmic adaptor subunit [Nitrospirota bacterium]